MDTKQLRIHLRMLDAALEHAALLAELGREASEGTTRLRYREAGTPSCSITRARRSAGSATWMTPCWR